MELRTRNILIFSLTIAFFVGVIAFRQVFWHGSVSVVGPSAPYSVFIKTEEHKCTEDICEIVLFPGNYSLQVQKEGYESLAKDVSVSAWKKVELSIPLEKVPNLAVVKDIPERKLHLFSAGTEAKVAFSGSFSIEETESEQKLFSGKTLLTTFPKASGISIASDEIGRGVWGITQDNVYFVDSALQQKTALFSGTGGITSLRTLSNGAAIVSSQEQGLWLVSTKKSVKKLLLPSSFLSIESICMPVPEKLFAIDRGENEFTAVLWDETTKESLGVLRNFDPEEFVSAECIAPKTVLIRFKKESDTRLLTF